MWRISGVIDGVLVNALVEMIPEMVIRLLRRTTVESCVFLHRVSNTRPKAITLDVEMVDYYRNEFISLTDIARYKSINPRITIYNWLRGRDVVEFLGLWEV